MVAPVLENDRYHMSQTVSPEKLRVWKLMEIAGILPNKKRRVFLEELAKKEEAGELELDERKIWYAQLLFPNDKQARRKRLKEELKKWEKRVNRYAPST